MILIGGVLWGECLPAQLPSPWSQLLLIEYVDQSTSTGVGLELYNPSGSTVDLAADNISIRFFWYSSCPSSCPSPTSIPLSGQIPPLGTYIVGNGAYCNSCPGGCDSIFTFSGLNGNDAVLLTRADTAIDMIGIPCFCIGPNFTSYMVDSVENALFHHNIARCIGNTTHYLDSNGVYSFGNDSTSWPNNQATNVQGWAVGTDQCITRGHTESCGILPITSLSAESNVENCRTQITWAAEEADSFQVMKLGDSGIGMVRIGVVHPQLGDSQHSFLVNPMGKEYTNYQVIAWAGGVESMQSNFVRVGRLEGNCIPKAAIVYPVPASDDLFVQLPEPGPLAIGIYDLRGQVVIGHEQSNVQKEHFLSVKELSEGLYFYRIVHGNNQLQTGKLLIQRE